MDEPVRVDEPVRADQRLAATFVGALFRPRATFAALADEPNARAGASAIAVLGIAWGALSAFLFAVGHAPPFVLVPIPPSQWFLVQALVMLPLLTGLYWVYSELAHRLARAAGGTGREGPVRAALGFAYAAPMLLHVLAELVALTAFGLDGLRAVARVSFPLAALGAWALASLALRTLHAVRWRVAIAAAFAGLFVQALAGALVLR